MNLENRGLQLAKIANDKPHGDRVKYMGGCRCMLCRAANSQYEVGRAAARRRGESNELVSAKYAQRHLRALSRHGIGRDTVSDITGLATSTIELIRTGKRKQIRRQNAAKIMAVTFEATTDAKIVPAARTWRIINLLLNEGFTKAEIARRLGCKMPALRIRKDLITARTAAKVERLYNQLMAEGE
jgi:hypothetical protein